MILGIAGGAYINYWIQKNVNVPPNVFTTVVPRIVGYLTAWWFVRKMNKIVT